MKAMKLVRPSADDDEVFTPGPKRVDQSRDRYNVIHRPALHR
jgi:hypothetical protein